MRPYIEEAILDLPKQEEIIQAIKEFADAKLGHLYQLTENQIANVLDAIAWYISEPEKLENWQTHKYVKKAKPKVFATTLLSMLQFQRHSSGIRIEMWAM